MSPHIRSAAPPHFETSHARALRLLHVRIATVASTLIVELWSLTAALEAWAEGRSAMLSSLVVLQCIAFAAAAGVWLTAGRHSAAR